MANLFNTLGVGYSGLSVAQVGISTTGHNISNAETEGYSRQKVSIETATPLSTSFGNVGNGATVADVKRVFDEFVFDRYTAISADKEYSDYQRDKLEQLSTYFPEVDNVGIKADLSEFYNMWQTFADNPNSDPVKVALVQQTQTLTQHIEQTQDQISSLQMQINEELLVSVNQVNEYATQIAELNKSINIAESVGEYTANDLRDKRNLLENNLSKLIGSDVSQGEVVGSDTPSYTLSVNGFNIVDGSSTHLLHISKESNPSGFYELSYERQDGALIPLEEKVNGGKIGAIFELRGGAIDSTSGMPTDGVIQNTLAQLDAFASGVIESTNNLYAASATTRMDSNVITANKDSSLLHSNLNIHEGSFDFVIYDLDGNETARRTININDTTVMSGLDTDSIEKQISANIDDTNDANASNDIDDFINFSYKESATGELRLELSMDSYAESQGFTFSIEENLINEEFSSGTNFAGALGLGRFFDGNDADSIRLNSKLEENPTQLSAGYSSVSGDNRVALNIVQSQFESYNFQVGSSSYDTTNYGMFDVTSTYVGVTTNSAITKNETISTQYSSIELEYASVSQVSIDEEMTNLIKYQTAYGASAKLITTIDEMMQTLLGIKQ